MSDQPGGFYDELAPYYERLFHWEKRLAAEQPAFADLWEAFGTQSVLDASCGSGRHVRLFCQMGLACDGADASPAMIELARGNVAGCQPAPRLEACLWEQLPATFPTPYDAVMCLGNSLPYVTEPAALQASLAGLWACVAEGGFLLIQLKNYAHLLSTRKRFLPLTWNQTLDDELVCVREYEYLDALVRFHVLLLVRRDGAWELKPNSTDLAPWQVDDLVPRLKSLGAEVSVYGSLSREPFDAGHAGDLVVLARRR